MLSGTFQGRGPAQCPAGGRLQVYPSPSVAVASLLRMWCWAFGMINAANPEGWKQNRSKADLVPQGLLPRALITAAGRLEETQVLARRVAPFARHLGCTTYFNGSTQPEVTKRQAAMRAGWASLGDFWTANAWRSTKHNAMIAFVVEAALSGLGAVAPTLQQMSRLTGTLCTLLRVLERGKAFKKPPSGEDGVNGDGTPQCAGQLAEDGVSGANVVADEADGKICGQPAPLNASSMAGQSVEHGMVGAAGSGGLAQGACGSGSTVLGSLGGWGAGMGSGFGGSPVFAGFPAEPGCPDLRSGLKGRGAGLVQCIRISRVALVWEL